MNRVALALALTAGLAISCSKPKKPKTPMAGPSPAPAQKLDTPLTFPSIPVKPRPTAPSPNPAELSRAIFFEFDSTVLSAEAMDSLLRLGDYMAANPWSRVTIAGHADERGTSEYNLALGEERARVARDFLARYQINPARIQIVSYGEELPLCEEEGEDCWVKNRRAEFELTSAVAQRSLPAGLIKK
jgi:peptidoglycan-associated lipoprotein